MRLTTKRLGSGWWIVGDEDFGPYGPYETRKEAEEDRIGVTRSIRRSDDREFFTSERSEN